MEGSLFYLCKLLVIIWLAWNCYALVEEQAFCWVIVMNHDLSDLWRYLLTVEMTVTSIVIKRKTKCAVSSLRCRFFKYLFHQKSCLLSETVVIPYPSYFRISNLRSQLSFRFYSIRKNGVLSSRSWRVKLDGQNDVVNANGRRTK